MRFGHKKHRSAAVTGSASDNYKSLYVIQVYSCVVTNDKTDADRLTVLISNLTITFKDDMLTF